MRAHGVQDLMGCGFENAVGVQLAHLDTSGPCVQLVMTVHNLRAEKALDAADIVVRSLSSCKAEQPQLYTVAFVNTDDF